VTLAGVIDADVTVRERSPNTNFGTAKSLEVDDSVDRTERSYVRVIVSGVGGNRVRRARLRLQVSTAQSSASDSGGAVYRISNCSWGESTTTWVAQPAIDGHRLDFAGPVPLGAVVEFDVTSAIVGDGVYCFAITPLSDDGAVYYSREAASGRPALSIVVGP
jgi:hypothetical protein